ncbi:MAG: hypothetical protein ACOZCO_15780 [Bacteroidota bacterium]
MKFKEMIGMQGTNQDTGNNHSSLLLYGAVMLANIDYAGVADYALKAFVGGTIWLGFKLAADYLSQKIKRKSK